MPAIFYNNDYYVLKRLGHYIMPCAVMLKNSGDFNNLLAFFNPDKTILIIIQNESKAKETLNVRIDNKKINPILVADSFNTFKIQLN